MDLPRLLLTFEAADVALDVRRFEIAEALSQPFEAKIVAVSPDQDIDFAAIVGRPASFSIESGVVHGAAEGRRSWRGVCKRAAQIRPEKTGLATYEVTIVPSLARLSLRRDHRIFQHLSLPDIVKQVLSPFDISARWQIAPDRHPKVEQKVQHGETDLDFVQRLLEEAGITFFFAAAGDEPEVTFSDAPETGAPVEPPVPFNDSPNREGAHAFVTRIGVARDARPTAAALRDSDFRNPQVVPTATAETKGPNATPVPMEHYAYAPGASWIEGGASGGTPVADQRGTSRSNEAHLKRATEQELERLRSNERSLAYETSLVELGAGAVFAIADHPSDAVTSSKWLAVAMSLSGNVTGEWRFSGNAVRADVPFRPPRRTPKPRASGLQTAVVVGAKGQEIHTDEFGRVRVRFRWDRSGKDDDTASPWLRVSHPAAGTGHGFASLPRVGQEVLVAFFEGDPDQPVIVGGAYNTAAAPALKLPVRAAASAWHSRSTPDSTGNNEIVLDDAAGKELLFLRAEKDLSYFVRRNEVTTVVQKRSKLVKGDEAETTGQDRIRDTTGARKKLLDHDNTVRIEKSQHRAIHLDRDTIVTGLSHTLVEKDDHAIAHKDERIVVKGKLSLETGADQNVVIGRHALEVTGDVHFKGQSEGILGGVKSVTLVAGSSYVLIDSVGVTVHGTLVMINSGGSAGQGSGAALDSPDPPPDIPEFDPPTPYDAPTPDGEEAPPVAPPEPPPPPKPPVELTFIEIHLVDADNEPVGGEKWRVRTPDGKVREGHLNSEGRARIDDIVPGECEISFPDLDARDLE